MGTVSKTVVKVSFSYTDHSTGSDAVKITQRLLSLFSTLTSFKTNQFGGFILQVFVIRLNDTRQFKFF